MSALMDAALDMLEHAPVGHRVTVDLGTVSETELSAIRCERPDATARIMRSELVPGWVIEMVDAPTARGYVHAVCVRPESDGDAERIDAQAVRSGDAERIEAGEMSAHTPGPWQVEEGFSVVGTLRTVTEYFVRRDGQDIAIAADILDPKTGEPSEANARLIAAAPSLLDACEDAARLLQALNTGTGPGTVRDALEFAIAAAKEPTP